MKSSSIGVSYLDNTLKINKIVTYGYQYLRLFVLDNYDKDIKYDRQFMYNILKSVCKNDGLMQ